MADQTQIALDRWGFPAPRSIRLVPGPIFPTKASAGKGKQHGAGSYSSGTVDAGLAKLTASRRPGQTFSQQEIADVCQVSKRTIGLIERQALRKLRLKISPDGTNLLSELFKTQHTQ